MLAGDLVKSGLNQMADQPHIADSLGVLWISQMKEYHKIRLYSINIHKGVILKLFEGGESLC
jgi:hypothetical protein